MKRFLKIIGIILVLVGIGLAILLSYVKIALPDIVVDNAIIIEQTPDRIARGEYLANHVTVCMDCHASRDWGVFAAPPIENTKGIGGEVFDQELGFPGRYIAPNITPYALGDWSDGEVYRAITSGVSKDGRALFSIMPYHNFGKMSKEDIFSIVAYLKSLPPLESNPEESISDFPMNFIINTIPKEPDHQEIPPVDNLIEYGQYMTNAAGCFDCHTEMDKGEYIGKPFAGGFEFKFPNGDLTRSPNITPSESGIKNWTLAQFIAKFKSFSNDTYKSEPIRSGEMQTTMPWTMFAGMKEKDLEAIYAYLRTVKPVENNIIKFEPK